MLPSCLLSRPIPGLCTLQAGVEHATEHTDEEVEEEDHRGILDEPQVRPGDMDLAPHKILWALVLGFALSAAVQAVVSKSGMTRRLPDDSPRTIAIASGLGAASSSCSYAAVTLARSIFRKGANFTAAMSAISGIYGEQLDDLQSE